MCLLIVIKILTHLFSIGIETRKAEIVVNNGANHVKIPGRDELFPVFDYSWLVTVFCIDGVWYRLEDPTSDCEGRAAHKEAKRTNKIGELERRESGLKERESLLRAAELDLERRKKEFDEFMAAKRSEQDAKSAPKIDRTENSPLEDVVARTPSSPGLSSHVGIPKRTNSSPSTSTSTFITARRRIDSRLENSSAHGASTPSTGSTPSSPLRSYIGASRVAFRQANISNGSDTSSVGSIGTPSPLATGLISVYLPEPRVSSLPSESPFTSIISPRSPTASPVHNPIRFGSPSSPRKNPIVPPVELSSSPGLSSLSNPLIQLSLEESPKFASVQHSPTLPPFVFEIPLDDIWTREQCDEWLASKNYPSTNLNDKTSSGQRAIHCAALDGQLKVVEFLVGRGGVDVSFTDLIGNTPLICAASKGKIDTAKWLISHGAIVDHKAPSGRSALHSAAAGGHVEMCEVLIQSGANPLEKEQFGKTPRALAESYNHRAVSEYLRQVEATTTFSAPIDA